MSKVIVGRHKLQARVITLHKILLCLLALGSLNPLLFYDLGIRPGSINSLDATTRGKMSRSDLLKSAQLSIAPVPDKAVQFV
jgi:hypothetical protein